jgi:hypothetical protein
MVKSRRGFFKIAGVGFLGIGSLLGSNSKVVHQAIDIHNAEFPIVASTKYYFPKGKTPIDIKRDLDKWGNIEKYSEIYNKLLAENKVSTKMDSTYKNDHLESKMYFKDMASYKEFIDLLSKNNVVNKDLQKELGYVVKTEVF